MRASASDARGACRNLIPRKYTSDRIVEQIIGVPALHVREHIVEVFVPPLREFQSSSSHKSVSLSAALNQSLMLLSLQPQGQITKERVLHLTVNQIVVGPPQVQEGSVEIEVSVPKRSALGYNHSCWSTWLWLCG